MLDFATHVLHLLKLVHWNLVVVLFHVHLHHIFKNAKFEL